MSELYSGLLWLVRPGEKREGELEKAVAYAEGKIGRPGQLTNFNPADDYPPVWGRIPVRPDGRVLANHVFLVTKISEDSRGNEDF